jgi:hypothetical protein
MAEFIESTGMVATAATLSLVSVVLGFELVELWYRESSGSKFQCVYVHALKEVHEKYPEIIVGHFPNHKKEHKHSPVVLLNSFTTISSIYVTNNYPYVSYAKMPFRPRISLYGPFFQKILFSSLFKTS